jgi:hypothetical protein
MRTMISEAEWPYRRQSTNSTYQISDRHFTTYAHTGETPARNRCEIRTLNRYTRNCRGVPGERGAGSAGGAKRRRPAVLVFLDLIVIGGSERRSCIDA